MPVSRSPSITAFEAETSLPQRPSRLSAINREFLWRIALVVMFVCIAHRFEWAWLRFLTSEILLRISAWVGLPLVRASFDTLSVHGELVRYVTACTFIDVCLGAFPLLWNLHRSWRQNVNQLMFVAIVFLAFNALRLEATLLLFANGVSWTLADGLPGGLAYFAVWLYIWRGRSSQVIGTG